MVAKKGGKHKSLAATRKAFVQAYHKSHPSQTYYQAHANALRAWNSKKTYEKLPSNLKSAYTRSTTTWHYPRLRTSFRKHKEKGVNGPAADRELYEINQTYTDKKQRAHALKDWFNKVYGPGGWERRHDYYPRKKRKR